MLLKSQREQSQGCCGAVFRCWFFRIAMAWKCKQDSKSQQYLARNPLKSRLRNGTLWYGYRVRCITTVCLENKTSVPSTRVGTSSNAIEHGLNFNNKPHRFYHIPYLFCLVSLLNTSISNFPLQIRRKLFFTLFFPRLLWHVRQFVNKSNSR